MPDIIKTTPNIPIKDPTNSIVDTTPSARGAMSSAMNAPKITIGNPTPKMIANTVIPNFGIVDFVVCILYCGNVFLLSIIYLSHYEKN